MCICVEYTRVYLDILMQDPIKNTYYLVARAPEVPLTVEYLFSSRDIDSFKRASSGGFWPMWDSS